MNNTTTTPTVMVILHPGFEEIEAITPIDLLRRAEFSVTTASTAGESLVTGRNNIAVHADLSLDSVLNRTFDCILLPGGPGIKRIKSDSRLHGMLRDQDARGGWIAAICAAPLVLHEAGVLSGRSFTGHQSIAEDLPELRTDAPVVTDQNLITSRGAGTAVQFGLTLVEILSNSQISSEIARSIHWAV